MLTTHEPRTARPTGETSAQRERRAERDRKRKLAKRTAERTPERQALIDYAQQLIFQADRAPDPETRRDLYRVASRLQLRNADEPEQQRDAVFLLLNKWALTEIPGVEVGLSVKDIALETGLGLDAVQRALDSLTSAEVDLVEIFTRGGRANCGRGGTTLYYRARRKPSPR